MALLDFAGASLAAPADGSPSLPGARVRAVVAPGLLAEHTAHRTRAARGTSRDVAIRRDPMQRTVALSGSITDAGPAHAMPLGGETDVLGCERMAALAMGLAGIVRRDGLAAKCVDASRHLGEVLRADTSAVPAQMVDLQASDQWPAEPLPCDPGGSSLPAIQPEGRITVLVDATAPVPADGRLLDLRHEARPVVAADIAAGGVTEAGWHS